MRSGVLLPYVDGIGLEDPGVGVGDTSWQEYLWRRVISCECRKAVDEKVACSANIITRE